MALDSRGTKNTSTPKMEAASGSAARGPAANVSKNVAVVGGSAAGLLTAAVLARQGVGVRVYERIETLEPAERTLIVTNRMRSLLGRAAEGCIVNEIRRFELFTDGRSATFELKQPDLIIERRALIQGLAAEARRAGAGLGALYGRQQRGNSRVHDYWRRWSRESRGAGGGMVAVGNCAAGAGDCTAAERYGAGYREGVVRAAGHSLFLLADSGIADARSFGIDWGGGAGDAETFGEFFGEARVDAAGISGCAHSGVHGVGAGAAAGGARIGLSGGRCGGAGEGDYRRRDRYGISRGFGRGGGDFEWRV